MDTSNDDRAVGRRNIPDGIHDTVMAVLRQNIPGIDQMVITSALLEQVKEVILKNMDQLTAVLSGALIALGSGFLVPSICIAVINAVGFTSGGVAAGSLAALIQSSVYGAWTGGVFSGLQSIGATAVIAPPVVIAVAATAVVVGGGVFAYRQYQRKKRRIALEGSDDIPPPPPPKDAKDTDRRPTSEDCDDSPKGALPSIGWK